MERGEDDNRIVYVGDGDNDNDGSYDNVSNCSYVLLPSAEKMVETDEAIETLRLAKQRHDSNLHINSVNSTNYIIDDDNISSTTSSSSRSSGTANSIDESSVNSDTSSGKNNFNNENFTKKDLLFIKLEERWNNRFVRSDKDCPVQPLPRKASAKKFQKKGKATHRNSIAYSNINNNKRNVYINNEDDDETFASRTLSFVPYNNKIQSHNSPSSFSGEHNLSYEKRENNNNVLYGDVDYDSDDGSDDVGSEEEISTEQLEEWSEQWVEEEEENVDNDSSIESSDAIARSVVNGDNNRPYLAFTDALETTSPSTESRTDTPMSNVTGTNGNGFVEVLTGNDVIDDENNYVGDMDGDDDTITERKDDTNSAETNNYSKYIEENDTMYNTLPSEVDSDTDVLDSNYNNANVTDIQENNAFSPSSEIDDDSEPLSEEQIINIEDEHTDFVNDANDINNITFLDGYIEQLVDNYDDDDNDDDDDDVDSGENSNESQISTNRNSKRKVRYARKRDNNHSVRKQDTEVGDSSIREMHAPYQHPSEGETLEQRLRRRERLFKEMKRLEHENKKLSVKENAG